MNDPADKPLLADLRAELAALGDELREMAAARWELARLELAADLRSARRLAICWLAAGVVALAVLPLLAVALADALDGCGQISRGGWLLLLAAGSAGAGRRRRLACLAPLPPPVPRPAGDPGGTPRGPAVAAGRGKEE